MNTSEQFSALVTQHAARPFILDSLKDRTITYREFHQLACGLAAEMRRRGVGVGDRVAMMMPNCAELAVLYFACIYLRAVVVPLNPTLGADDLRFILANARPKLLLYSTSAAAKIAHVDGIPGFCLVARHEAESAPEGAIDIESLPAADQIVPMEGAREDELVAIMYTSGTTSRPKGLVHQLSRMLRNATAFADTQGINRESRFYHTLAMSYMGGFYNLLLLPFLRGASIVLDHVFDARTAINFWAKAIRYQANALWLAPTVMSVLLKLDRGHAGEEFCRKFVRHTFVGFAPLPVSLKHDFERRYGVRVRENYGLSETLFVSCSSGGLDTSGVVGTVLPGIELRVVGERGEALTPGSEGEIELLTPDLMAGYVDESGKIVPADARAWFATGDFGCLGSDGHLYITGRKKDIIIRGGINISPVAVEEALRAFPGVSDVAVVSVPHELYGEDIAAVLKLAPGIELAAIQNRLAAHAQQHLAPYQQPARYIAIDDFPKTASGKVQKGRLRELVLGKLQMAQPARKVSA